jgi:dTDP-4-dehydrorhamnose 3,5-epimerase
MTTEWQHIEPPATGASEIAGLPGVRLESIPVFHDPRGSLHELFRTDEIPAGFTPLMACSSWSHPGVSRGPHEHVAQDDYFTFAGPSDFVVVLWDARPGGAGAAKGWRLLVGEKRPSRIYVPHGVVHGYKNIGTVPGLVVTVASSLFKGEKRREPVDEIRHELNPSSPYHFPDSYGESL